MASWPRLPPAKSPELPRRLKDYQDLQSNQNDGPQIHYFGMKDQADSTNMLVSEFGLLLLHGTHCVQGRCRVRTVAQRHTRSRWACLQRRSKGALERHGDWRTSRACDVVGVFAAEAYLKFCCFKPTFQPHSHICLEPPNLGIDSEGSESLESETLRQSEEHSHLPCPGLMARRTCSLHTRARYLHQKWGFPKTRSPV